MTIKPQRGTPGSTGVLAPVEPALIVKLVVRPLTRILNPLIVRLAGRRHFRMAAQIRHVGRRSGRSYVTPAGARLHGEVIMIPLTFGNQSDWAKNVRAAGGCSLKVNGEEYTAVAPQFVDRRDAGPLLKSAFGPVERAGFRLLGIKQYLRLDVVPSGQAG